MYAIVKTGGKQYKVKADDFVEIERIVGEVGTKVTLGEVLAVGEEGGELKLGNPLLDGAKVEAEIVDQFRGKKIVVFKMKRRKGYRKTKGHRQEITRIKVSAITA